MDEAVEMTNEYAPEHLIIEVKDYMEISERIVNAGSVFLGYYSPESAGDYASGTNHTLPTNGYAKPTAESVWTASSARLPSRKLHPRYCHDWSGH